MAEITKQALQVSNNTSFPNNNAGAITPSDLRAFNVNMIDSLVDEIGYNVDSASWNRSINALNTFTSSQQPSFTALNQFTASQLTINTGVNAFTQSADARLDALESETQNLELFTSSVNQIADNGIVQGTSTRLHFYGLVSASIVPNVNGAIASINIEQDGTKLNSSSFNSYTASNDTKWNNLTAQSGSWITESESGSFLVTASVNLNTITFTKGNNTTFAITVNTGSGGATTDITALNAFTASQLTINSGYNTFTSSTNISISNLNTTTASLNSSVTQLNAYTASNDTKWNTLGALSGSFVTESETASFARTNVDNNFTANQTFTNITAVSASFTYVQTTYETSSVIYSSGSNIFGDELSDTQTLSGSVKVQGSLTVNGTPVLTSSVDISGLVTTASFNAYTQSNDQKVNSLISATASYATTGSNIFYGDQIVTASAGFYSSNDTAQKLRLGGASNGQNFDFRVTGSGIEQQLWLVENQGGVWGNSFFNRVYIDSNLNVNSTFTASLQQGYVWVGDSTGKTITVATSSFGSSINTGSFATTGSNVFTGDQTLVDAAGNSVTLSDVSGSLMLVAKTFTSASTHLTSSANSFVNLIFKDNNNTTDTIISGSGNIFTNPSAATSTFKRYVGGANNIYTSNAIPQISSSMQFTPNMNRNIGNFPAILRGPVSSSAWNLSDNVQMSSTVNIGNTTSANDKMISGFTYVGNGFFGGILNVSANSTPLTTAPSIQSNLIFGATLNLNNNSSSLTYNSNIQNGGITINNNYVTASGASTPFRNAIANINTVYGVNHKIDYAGTNTTNSMYRAATANFLAGTYITASLEGTGDNTSMVAVSLMGNGLIVSGTSTGTTSLATPTTNATYGTVISGRYNATDGNRAKTAETIFAVGTGTSYTNRKTGFLIDSGSNAFFEGTVNVSGSLTVQSGSTFFANGNKQFNVGAFQSDVTQSGSANVSQSMNFEVTDISEGVSIASNSRITLANAGTYNIQFSVQVDRVSGSGTDTVHIWLKKNGTNVDKSAGAITIAGSAAEAKTVAAWNYVVNAAANDYYELVWQSTDTNIQLINQAATGNIPSTPSIILTVTQVR